MINFCSPQELILVLKHCHNFNFGLNCCFLGFLGGLRPYLFQNNYDHLLKLTKASVEIELITTQSELRLNILECLQSNILLFYKNL